VRLPAAEINHGKSHSATFQANTDVGHVGPLPTAARTSTNRTLCLAQVPQCKRSNCLAIGPAP
jgi:hypothetical protein